MSVETRLRIAAIALLLIAPTFVQATDVELPVERLAYQLVHGDVAEARAGFAALLDGDMADIEALRARSVDSAEAQYHHASLLRSMTQTIRVWEGAELARRGRSREAIPDDVVDRLLTACDHAEEQSAELRSGYAPSSQPPHRARDIEDASKDVGLLLLRSNAFVAGTSFEDRRQQLLDRARELVEAPGSVEEFEAKYGSDPERAFNLQPRPTGRSIGAVPAVPGAETAVPRAGASDDDDPALEALVRSYCEHLLAGEIDSLESLFADGAMPRKDEVREAAAELAGWSLAKIGEIHVRELTTGDLEVSIEGLELTDTTGKSRRTRDTIVVRRVDEAAYRIVKLGRAGG